MCGVFDNETKYDVKAISVKNGAWQQPGPKPSKYN